MQLHEITFFGGQMLRFVQLKKDQHCSATHLSEGSKTRGMCMSCSSDSPLLRLGTTL